MRRFPWMAMCAALLIAIPAIAEEAAEGAKQTVSGKIVVPELPGDQKLDFSKVTVMLAANVQPPQPPYPANYAQMTTEEKQKWAEGFTKTDEYKAWSAEVQKVMASAFRKNVVPDASGVYTIEGVPTGKYNISIVVRDPSLKKVELTGRQSVSVADKAVAADVTLEVNRRLDVGDEAPAFAVKTVDGKDLKLSDYRGKYVLVDFWAVWCGPCRGETPNLKEVYAEFGKHSSFAMIGLSLDKETKEPIDYFKKEELGWVNGFLGEWNEDKVTKDYGVRGIPQIMLIGPDGKIVARDLRGERIKATVKEFLSKETLN